jgi:hypothetical protein
MIIDANVFKGYFQVEMGNTHTLCGCPQALLRTTSPSTPVFHDDGGVIEHEWRGVVDRDWFDAWLATHLQLGTIQYATPRKDGQAEKELQALGFPGGRDIVYVRLGLVVAASKSLCYLYTEDMDFYDPTMKGCGAQRRIKLLRASSGPVAKALAKRGLLVKCVP